MSHIYKNTKTIKLPLDDEDGGIFEIPLVHVLAEGQVISVPWGREELIPCQ
jgi:hypothetical protein